MTTNQFPSDTPNPSENPESSISESNNEPITNVNESTPSEVAETLRAMADAAATIANLGRNLEGTTLPSDVSDSVTNIAVTPNASMAANDDAKSGKFFSQLKGVPIDYLISTPLVASARSNMALAQVMLEFIDMIGFKEEDKTTRLIEFDLTRPYEDPVTRKWEKQKLKVEAPLLGLVPIPALLVDSVDINLTVKIDNSLQTTSETKTSATTEVGANWGWGHATFTGSVSTSEANIRHTDQSATYTVGVRAQQQPLPEGMARLMDVMASCVTPLPQESAT